MTPQQPATEAGRALLAQLTARTDYGGGNSPPSEPDETWWIDRDRQANRILAIEAEAAAGLLALRDAAKWVIAAEDEDEGGEWSAAHEELRRVLADTAPAAAEIEARIEQRLISRLVNDPTHIGVVSNETGDCYPLNSEAVEHLLLRERPAASVAE